MENKHNFAGIIIPVIIAVILLTVLPIINSINVECPPCEEIPSYDIGQISVNPNFSSGDYIVDKGSYDYIDSVTIIKDNNLTPENIKKDVNIFGVVGTYQILLPTLYTPSISISDDTLIITPNSNNGAFVTGYKIYVDDVLLDTTTSTTYDLSNELTEADTYVITVKAYGTNFNDSSASNSENYTVVSGYTVTLTSNSDDNAYNVTSGYLSYSVDGGSTWVDVTDHADFSITLNNVETIMFKLTEVGSIDGTITNTTDSTTIVSNKYTNWTSSEITITKDTTFNVNIQDD